MLKRIGAIAALTSLMLPASAWAGDLVLVGGSWQWPATGDPYGISIYQEIVELAGGPEAAKIGIFTTASSSAAGAQENGSLYVEDFQDLYQKYYPNREPDVEWIPLQIDNCNTAKNDPAIALQINSRNAFVFGGGAQSLITECFFNENPVTETRTTNEDDWSISDVSMTYLTAGDRYDPLTKTATFPRKTPAACAGETIPTSTDIFSAFDATGDRPNPREFINVALDLAASCATTATGRSAQTDPVVQVTMSDESATSYVGFDSQGIKKQSFVNLTVDIKREVPEPSTVGMIGMGILGMLWRRRCP